MEKKKILFVSTLTPPFYGSSLSSEMCLNILKKDGKYDVTNIKLNYSFDMSDVGKLNLNKILGFFKVRKQIRVSLKQFQPEIIYFVPAVTGLALIRDFLYLRSIKSLKNGKLILHIRGQFLKKDWQNPITKYIIKSLLVCDKVIVLGPELIANLKNRILKENIFVLINAIPNTLSNDEFEEIIIQRNLNSDLNLLFLSNMHEAKGWFKVLEVSKLLFDSGIKFSCHFVGGWASKNDNKKFFDYINKNNLSNNIFYHGQLLNEEKNQMLAKSNIMIYPTEYNDACPRVIIEAMEYGLTVIASNEAAIPSLILDDETGIILKKNTVDDIFKNILKLNDNTYRRDMEIKARERFLERFTLQTYKNRFIEIFSKI
ncbi:MAG: glycosyltransferase family 4 protein [Cyclobacteriaceae bacterium]